MLSVRDRIYSPRNKQIKIKRTKRKHGIQTVTTRKLEQLH